MSLPLDARHRAMLQEMGVRVWSPVEEAPMAAVPTLHAVVPHPAVSSAAPQTPPPTSTSPYPPTARVRTRATTAATPPPHLARGDAGPVGLLHPVQRLFVHAHAEAAQGPSSALGAAWLVVAEGRPDADPLAGEAGALLRNMLSALQLHQHPRIFFCSAELATDHPRPDPASESAAVLAQALAEAQPTMILLMGRLAARTVLNRTEPLGQLRAQPHSVSGHAALVTYDAPYLLRHGQYKAAAWADLCLARALVQAGYKG